MPELRSSGLPVPWLIRTGEQRVSLSDGNAAEGALGDIVADLKASAIEEATQREPSPGLMGNGLGHVGLRRQAAQCSVQCLA